MDLLKAKYNECINPEHDKNLCVPALKTLLDQRGLGCMIIDQAKNHTGKILQVDSETGKTETHDMFMKRCVRVAHAMRQQGIGPGHTVSCCTANSMDSNVPFIASIIIGAVIAPLDPALALKDTIDMIKLMKPTLIFCDKKGSELVDAALSEVIDIPSKIVSFDDNDKYIPFSAFFNSYFDEEDFEATPAKDLNDGVCIVFSSGTTGTPKGIHLSHFSILYQLKSYPDPMVIFAATRMYWLTGVIVIIQSVLTGGKWISCSNFDMKKIFKIISDNQVSFLLVPPVFACQINKNRDFCQSDVSSLGILIVTGGLISENELLNLRNLFPKTYISSSYGATETCGHTLSFNLKMPSDISLLMSKPTSIGRPVPGTCVKVVDVETGKIVGANELGELRVKCVQIMLGYYKNPASTRKAFDDQGYYCTGDLVYYDEDYCFFVKDRINDIMKYQGWKFASGELEEILQTHPDVNEAAVIAIPHPEDEDHPMGIVVLREGAKATAQDLIKFTDGMFRVENLALTIKISLIILEQVSNCKRLRGGVKIVDTIPRTPSAKLRKRDLRDMVLQGKI